MFKENRNGDCRLVKSGGAPTTHRALKRTEASEATRKRAGIITARQIAKQVSARSPFHLFILPKFLIHVLKIYISVIRRCVTCMMGVMGVFKWLRKDIVQRDRERRGLTPKINGLNNEAYRNALQAFIDRRRNPNDLDCSIYPNSPDKERLDFFIKTKDENEKKKKRNDRKEKIGIPGVPQVPASEIFEIGWIAGTEDRYMELMFAEWQNTRVALRRHTHPECRDAIKADLEVLMEIRHPNVLLLMATTHTDDHGLVAIFEPVDCTLYNFVHEQGERVSVQGIAKCAGNLAGALKHAHMRGYVHGAISSHCVFLATCGSVKLGGWELANSLPGPKKSQEFEQRLRYEIYKWQAPEIFRGQEPSPATDVYGLALLMWEMCTMNIPWNGLSKSELEAQYVQWERGVVTDLYNFPPLLNKLLDAGLQLEVSKRTLDMSRMRRFLQTLEIQYENSDPIYIEPSTNNNNSPKSVTKVIPERHSINDSLPVQRYTAIPTPKSRSERKVVKTKNVPRPLDLNISENAETTGPQTVELSFGMNDTAPAGIFKQVLKRTTSIQRVNARNVNKASPNKKISATSQQRHTTIGDFEITIAPKRENYRNSIQTLDSSDEESSSLDDTREKTKKLRQSLADKRKYFFWGSDSSQCSPTEDDIKREIAKSKILTQVRSKDYEPHKPASHKTSLELKPTKSRGQFNSPSPRVGKENTQKSPYSYVPLDVRDAVSHPKILNSDSQSFFESSLWRKEKMICMSKMRKDPVDSTTFCIPRVEPKATEKPPAPEPESPQSDQTYTLDTEANAIDEAPAEITQVLSSPDAIERKNSLQALRDSLDRATEIVMSTTTTVASSPPKSPETSDTNASSQHESVFEKLYELNGDASDTEIQSIERDEEKTIFFSSENKSKDEELNDKPKINDDKENSTEAENTECKVKMRRSNRDDVKRSSFDPARHSGLVCESIAENLNESDNSSSYSKQDDVTITISGPCSKPEITISQKTNMFEILDDPTTDDDSEKVEKSYALMIFGEKNRECHSCNPKSNLPRRRSLPAAFGQLRNMSNVSLGKLPIKKAGAADNTVEDIYIDDEFGDSLNVNMVLLDGDVTTDDENFIGHSELSDAQDYL